MKNLVNTENTNLVANIFVSDNDNDTLSFIVCNDSNNIYIASDVYVQDEQIFTYEINKSHTLEQNVNSAIKRFCDINKYSQTL